jgi:anti-sigma-K factor RskA
VLGALEEAERVRFVSHLRGCNLCRDEVDRLQVAADVLPRSVTPLAAPESLKKSIMDVVEADRAPAARPGPARRLRDRLPAIGAVRPRMAVLGSAAVLFVGLLAGFGISQLVDQGGGERTLSAKFDTSRVSSGSGNLVIGGDSDQAGGTLRVHGMPSLSGDETYQVWLQRDGEVIPKALFNVGDDGNGLTAVDGDLRDAQAVMVTREPAGGSRSPSGPPVLTVKL